jgi:hypothetical protein
VHEEKIDIIRAKLSQALSSALDRSLVGEVTGPYLSDKEDLLAVYLSVLNALTYLFLVAVDLGRVYVPVT